MTRSAPLQKWYLDDSIDLHKVVTSTKASQSMNCKLGLCHTQLSRNPANQYHLPLDAESFVCCRAWWNPLRSQSCLLEPQNLWHGKHGLCVGQTTCIYVCTITIRWTKWKLLRHTQTTSGTGHYSQIQCPRGTRTWRSLPTHPESTVEALTWHHPCGWLASLNMRI